MAVMLATGRVTMGQVDDALGRHSRQGRHGVVALRRAVAAWSEHAAPPDSALEVRMARLLLQYSLPPADFHARVAGYEVDFLMAASRVVIECDGWATHGLDRDQFEFDRKRDAALLAAGYVVIHVTWTELLRHPDAVARRVRAVLRSR